MQVLVQFGDFLMQQGREASAKRHEVRGVARGCQRVTRLAASPTVCNRDAM